MLFTFAAGAITKIGMRTTTGSNTEAVANQQVAGDIPPKVR
jgi:hypothetical protein